ncbi:putative Fibroblast growth factor receptor 3 [Hypsibius exemplaris]|uniref:Fibroblast growth factor receptor 3 n=1 Tax=Hypsibius exemplaris TaxID=2072580 RepID=A0A1W0XBQ6_HYPEX|nr:putative Fibroblast growth factor receptor 3 [Hypsibius exemplaris]
MDILENLPLLLEYCPVGSLHLHLSSLRFSYVYSHINDDGNIIDFDEHRMHQQWIEACQTKGRAPGIRLEMMRKMTSTWLLIRYAQMVARGMEHKSLRYIMHRDLTARNVLVAEYNVLKIFNFGLAKHVAACYVMSSTQIILPVRWMPPEAILSRIFSEKSVVWSFGILLWDISLLASNPFD